MLRPILLAAGLLGFTTQQADAACSLNKVIEFHVVVENNQILIPVVAEGQNVKFLLDTAFPANLMPSSQAARLGLPVVPLTGSQHFFNPDAKARVAGVITPDGDGTTHISELLLGGKTMKGVTFGVFHSNDSFGPDVVAMISSFIWRDYEVDIDLAHNLVTLLESHDCAGSNLAYWGNSYNVVDLVKSSELGTEFTLKVNGREMSAVLDSGSPYSSISEKGASRAGLNRPDDVPVTDAPPPLGIQATDLPALIRFSHGYGLAATPANITTSNTIDLGPQMPHRYWPARVESLAIDQEVISPVMMRVVPTPVVGHEFGTRTPQNLTNYDVLLGMDFLMTHRVLISRTQGKLYFSYLGNTGFGQPN